MYGGKLLRITYISNKVFILLPDKSFLDNTIFLISTLLTVIGYLHLWNLFSLIYFLLKINTFGSIFDVLPRKSVKAMIFLVFL